MDVTEGRGPKRQRAGRPSGPYMPSPRDLAIYAALAEGRTSRDVGNEFQLSHVRILKIADQIDKWLAPQWMDSIRELKARQTESLMFMFREAMAAWQASKKEGITSTEKSNANGAEQSITRKTRVGTPAFLSEARAALADIRKIWGADAPVVSGDAASDWISGRPREEAIRERIARMQAAIEPRNN